MEISSKDLSLNEKLKILADAAKYDVACTSSGSSRRIIVSQPLLYVYEEA
jgi:hypothetical protein